MRTGMTMLAVLGLSVAIVSCGDDETTSGTPATSSQETTTSMSTAQKEAMLLDVADVGENWKVGEDINEMDLASFAQIPCENSALNPTIIDRLTADAGIQFDPVDRSYRHIMELLVTGDPDRLAADLEFYFEAMTSCATVDSTVAGSEPMMLQELTIPELGDQRMAFEGMAAESPDSTSQWYMRTAVVRVGSVAVELGLVEILAPQEQPAISNDEFVNMLETAVDKLAG